MRFGNKISLIFIVFFVVGLVATHLMRSFGIPGTGHAGSLQEEEQKRLNELRRLVDYKKAHLLEFIGERQNDLRVLTFGSEVQTALAYLTTPPVAYDWTAPEISTTAWARELHQEILRLQNSYEGYRDAAVWRGDSGWIIFSGEGDVVLAGIPVDLMVRRQIVAGIHEYVEFYVSPVTGIQYLVISRRVIRTDGVMGIEKEPILFISLFLEVGDTLSRILKRAELDPQSPEVVLVNDRAQIVAHYHAPKDHTAGRLAPIISRLIEGKRDISGVERDAQGRKLMVGGRYFPLNRDMGLGLLVMQDYGAVYAQMWRRNLINIEIGLLGMVFILLLSMVITRSFLKPLNELVDVVERVRHGDRSLRVNVHGQDEVGGLSRTFNEMLDAVERSHQELDAKVKERTHKLSELNQQLQIEIEERREAQRQLEESRDRYQRISDNVPGVLYQLVQHQDSRLHFSFIAEGCRSLFDIPAEEVMRDSQSLWGLMREEDRTALCASLQQAGETSRPWTWDGKLSVRGEEMWARWVAHPQRQAAGETVWDGLIVNITEPKRLELELSQINSVLNAIFEGTVDALYAKDPGGRYIRINHAGAAMLGKKPAEIIGRREPDLMPAEQAAHVEEIDRQVITRNEPVTFEEKISMNGQARVYLTTKNAYRDESGAVIGLIGIRRDITEMRRGEDRNRALAAAAAAAEVEHYKAKQLQEAYDQLKKMQARLVEAEKLSGIGQLAAGVAHELNSPLTGLLSLLGVYAKKESLDASLREDVSVMRDACEHMAGIVRDLTSFARQSRGEKELLDINEVIGSTLRFGEILLTKQRITVQTDFTQSLGRIRGDKSQLQQVILNFITNARDAMPDGGTFSLRTYKEQARVVIEFRDTGCGMRKEVMRQIFEPFYTTKGPGKGVGLGLSISYGIISDHSGEISVESTPTQGTVFRIYLPQAGAA